MELIRNVTFSDEEMESLSHMFSNVEEESNHSTPHCVGLSYGTSSSFLPFIAPFVDESLFYSASTNVTYHHGVDASFLPMQSCFFSGDTNHDQYLKSMDYYSMNCPNYDNNALLEPVFTNVDDMHGSIEKVADKTSLTTAKIDDVKELSNSPHDSTLLPRKKSNISSKENAKKRKENTMTTRKKKRKTKNSSEYSSEEEDDSNASRELTREANSESKIKTRASRGAATDPQSLYARKRRERINERLRILQNIVPNGTKVDISTMLEEAVHYVKFLQLQIKLLSSDELWMFAPIAYNGMDIGLYQRLTPTLNFSAQN